MNATTYSILKTLDEKVIEMGGYGTAPEDLPLVHLEDGTYHVKRLETSPISDEWVIVRLINLGNIEKYEMADDEWGDEEEPVFNSTLHEYGEQWEVVRRLPYDDNTVKSIIEQLSIL
jgi:hypothetical protein